jgi:hypothetical protein
LLVMGCDARGILRHKSMTEDSFPKEGKCNSLSKKGRKDRLMDLRQLPLLVGVRDNIPDVCMCLCVGASLQTTIRERIAAAGFH